MSDHALADMLLTAQMQADLALALYGGPLSLETLAQSLGARYRYMSHGNVCCGALIFDDCVHVSIAGTNDRLDWAQNTQTKGRLYFGFTAHSGFVQAAIWASLAMRRAGIHNEVEKKPLILGGHSSGGAVAQLISVLPEFHPREIVTFGSPRVFADTSAASYRGFRWETFRFVMSGDPVPQLPLKGLHRILSRPNYSHTSDAIWLRANGKLSSGDVGFFLRAFGLLRQSISYFQAAGHRMLGLIPAFARSHKMSRYAAAIKKGVHDATN